jgi:hypothetical protein
MHKWLAGKNVERSRLLQRQRLLLHQGLVATAEVLEASLSEDKVGNLLPVRLWLKLKKTDGSFIYTHTLTLVSLKDIPVGGQTLRVKYLPDNLSSVIIL